jgi:hypothetical protein
MSTAGELSGLAVRKAGLMAGNSLTTCNEADRRNIYF